MESVIDYTEALDRNRVQGHTTHERCGTTECEIREQFTQATRTEPMRSLGRSAFCPTCQVSFKVEGGDQS